MAAMAAEKRGLDAPPRPARRDVRGAGVAGQGAADSVASPSLVGLSQHQAHSQTNARPSSPGLYPAPSPRPASVSSHATLIRRSSKLALCCSSNPSRRSSKNSKIANRFPEGQPLSPTPRHDVRQQLHGTLDKYCKNSFLATWQPRELTLLPEKGLLLVRDPKKDDDDAWLEEMARQLTSAPFDRWLVKLNHAGDIVRYAGHPVTKSTLNGTAYEGTYPLRLNGTRLWNLQGAEVSQERVGGQSVLVVTTYTGEELRISTPNQRDVRRWKQSLRFVAGGGGRTLSDDDDDANSMDSWPSSSSMDESEHDGSSDDDSDGGRWQLPPDWTAVVSRRTGLRYWVNRETGEQSRSHPGRRAGRHKNADRVAHGAAVIRNIASSASSEAKKRMLQDRALSRSRRGSFGDGSPRQTSRRSRSRSPTVFDSLPTPNTALSPRAFSRGSAGRADDDVDMRPRLDPTTMKLRHEDGRHRQHREFSLDAGRLSVHEKKHWCPGKDPHKHQTHIVMSVRPDSSAANPLGFTVTTASGDKLTIVAKNISQKQLWVDALEETALQHKLAGSRAVRHHASGWERLVRRLLRRARRRDYARLQHQYRPGITTSPQTRRKMRQLERERRLAEEHAEDLQLKLQETEHWAHEERRRRQEISSSVADELADRTAEIEREAERRAHRRVVAAVPVGGGGGNSFSARQRPTSQSRRLRYPSHNCFH